MLKEGQISLIPISSSDTEFVLSLRNKLEIADNFFSEPPLYDFKHNTWLKNINNGDYYFIINYNETKCGIINITNLDYKNQKAEYGIVLHDEYRGKGLAYNSSKMLLNYIFNNLNIQKIYLEVFSDNKYAIKLYKKLGFKQEGLFKKEIFKNGFFKDVMRMAIFKFEWMKKIENNI